MNQPTALARHPLLELDRFVIRRNFWAIAGAKFRIFDEAGALVATSKQKAFKLKEDVRIFADEAMTQELIRINARSVIDFSASYDVTDAVTGQHVGALRRKGLKSIFKDEWLILNHQEQEIGTIKEDSGGMAFLRRFLTNLIPQRFDLAVMGQYVGSLHQHFNPFVFKADVDLSSDPQRTLDRRLALAGMILLLAVEGRQG